jgi:D-tyrosyl-tRNA(Tyr) deacylase
MRLVLQRVSRAQVSVDGEVAGEIGRGLLVLLGVQKGDGTEEIEWGARKTAELRIFQDEQDKMNLNLVDVNGEALVVSQFTLLANAEKGRRPSFTEAAPPEEAERLYLEFVDCLRKLGVPTATGTFAARMSVSLVNEGPVTIVLERKPSGANVA